MDPMKDLFQELGFFIMFLYYPHPSWMYEEKKELILSKTEAVANEAASLIFLSRNNLKRADMANELSELIDKIVRLKPKIKEIFVQIPESLHSNLPMMTNGLNLISSLMEDMRELLKCEPSSISSVMHVIKMLDSGFESLKGFLLVTSEQHHDDEEIKDLCT
ncbi:hypothetical protein ACH5RR_036484 [Cinchona calisaya]|uniref:Uncharacterized protein n=1 Tax=Cinchona calisaya TaxID=153742 RepID=A0ABD2Y776_9GENT